MEPAIDEVYQDSKESRLFNPCSRYGRNIDPDDVGVRGPHDEWTYVGCEHNKCCVKCGHLHPHPNSILISVDGACMRNGESGAAMAAGVFFRTNSRWNISKSLNGPRNTNQVAELKAGIMALEQALEIQRDRLFQERRLWEVIVKADSKYLVQGITEYIFKWRRNRFLTGRGRGVVNGELFKRLDELVYELNRKGVEVFFWHVTREFNIEADKLARIALL